MLTVPVGDVLVGNAGSNVEHDDTALAVDVVAISETTELLLTRGIPDVEADGTEVGGERKRVHFHTESSCSVWRSMSRPKDRDAQRGQLAHQCTSSRIHPSSGAMNINVISTRSLIGRSEIFGTYLDEGSFASTTITNCISSRHIVAIIHRSSSQASNISPRRLIPSSPCSHSSRGVTRGVMSRQHHRFHHLRFLPFFCGVP